MAFILLFGISHLRYYGLAAWAIFYVPDLFGVCHLLLVLWAIVIYAGSSRLYLVSRKSAEYLVLVVFFLCVVLFASRNVLLFHDFRSSDPAISPVDLVRVF